MTQEPALTTQQRRDARETLILSVAIELFLDHGFGTTTIDQVAQTANCSKATIYKRYNSKEELFQAAIGFACERMRPTTLDPAWFPATPPAEALISFGKSFVRMMTSPQAARLRFLVAFQSRRFPDLARAFVQAGPRQVCGDLAAYFEYCRRRGLLIVEDPAVAADHFLSSLLGIPDLEVTMGLVPAMTDVEIHQHVERGAKIFLAGVRPNPKKGSF